MILKKTGVSKNEDRRGEESARKRTMLERTGVS